MAANSDDFEAVKQKVEAEAQKVRDIIEGGFQSSGVIGVASKMDIYTAIYNVCPLTNDTSRWNQIGDLFIKLLKDYIEVVTRSCEAKRDEPRTLLAHVCKKYDDYNVYLKVLTQFFLYIGRWIETIQVLSSLTETSPSSQRDGPKISPKDQMTACGIQVLARADVFRKFLDEAVTPATLRVVDERRTQHNSKALPPSGRGEVGTVATVQGGDPDFSLMARTVKLYKDLGNGIFEGLEQLLLGQCSEFYKAQSLGWLEDFGCYDYFRKGHLARQFEQESGTICLPQTSVASLLFQFDVAATSDHQDRVLAKSTGVVQLLQAYSEGWQPSFTKENCQQEDGVVAPLKVMFTMLQHVDPEDRNKRKEKVTGLDGAKHGLVPMQNALASFIPKELSAQCDALEIPPAPKGEDKPAKPRPLEYIKQVIGLKEKYDFLVLSALNDDRRFHKAVQTCFEQYINKEKGRVAEFLSLYLHSVMKKSAKGNEDYDTVISQCMNILTLTRDKDMFFEYYKKHFAMRLLGDRNQLNKDSELIFLAMLKERVGVHQAHHLEKMFKDIEISDDLIRDFKQLMEAEASKWPPGPPLIDLGETVVVTVGHWPKGYTAQGAQPRELLPTCEAFKKFYVDKHSGRRLSWDMSKGRAELGFKNAKIEVSTYQMCILLSVNEQTCVTRKALQEQLNLDKRVLDRNLNALCQGDRKKKMWSELLSLDKTTDMVSVNSGFKSKIKKCSFMPEAANAGDAVEQQKMDVDIQEKRKFEMRAALVRVMKTEKTCTLQLCMSKAISQLSTRFVPVPRDMKTQIERLIEQEFFKRDDGDRNTLVYLA